MAFLLTFFAHADHFTKASISAEQQNCYICYQSIDSPPELEQLAVNTNHSFAQITVTAIDNDFSTNYFVLPALRAPPVFQ